MQTHRQTDRQTDRREYNITCNNTATVAYKGIVT